MYFMPHESSILAKIACDARVGLYRVHDKGNRLLKDILGAARSEWSFAFK